MCSRSRKLSRLALGLGLILPLAIGCGHKENPKPPPQKIPQPIMDLVVAQRGDELLFSFTYPQTTISGLPIDDIVAIELWEFEMAVPDLAPPVADEDDEGGEGEESEGEPGDAPADDEEEPGAEAEGADEDSDEGAQAPDEGDHEDSDEGAQAPDEGDDEEPDDRARVPDESGEGEGAPSTEEGSDEAEQADDDEDQDEGEDESDESDDETAPEVSKESVLEVDPREFAAAAKRRLRLEGEELSKAISGNMVKVRVTLDRIDPEEMVGFAYGVRSFQTLERPSNFSNLFTIVPRLTPDPPELELEPVQNGVKISWTYEGDEPKEFRFYRRDALAPVFDLHFGTQTGDSDQFLDSTAEFGKTYTYAMALVVNQTPLVESALTPEREIQYLDNFAPGRPTDLAVLSEVGTARLLWEASPDRDVAGYIVYRRSGGGKFERLNERPVREAEYSDTAADSGRVYTYRVVAVDREGNVSDPSEEVEVRIP